MNFFPAEHTKGSLVDIFSTNDFLQNVDIFKLGFQRFAGFVANQQHHLQIDKLLVADVSFRT